MFCVQPRPTLSSCHFGMFTPQFAIAAQGKPLAFKGHSGNQKVSPRRVALPQAVAEDELISSGPYVRVQGSQPAQPRHFR
jgi:hypothetical protein